MNQPRWDLLTVPGVQTVIERAARNIYQMRSHTTEVEDLIQEATIFVATKNDLRWAIEGDGGFQPGLLYHRLRNDLMDLTKTDDKYLGSRVSYERLVEEYTD